MIKRLNDRGFSLIELMFGLALAGLAVTLGFSSLGKAKTAGSSRGLATAVAAEFRHAREKAIAKGSPVAVVIPSSSSRSLYWLEGTTEPVVTRATNFEGDYPNGAITVATYPGPTYQKNATMPGFKADSWAAQLDDWLPAAHRNDFVFMFTPNGSVLSNDLPSADLSYRVVVGMGAEISPTGPPGSGPDWVSGNDQVYYSLGATGEPYTIAISLNGAVESNKGLLGWNGSGINDQGAGAIVASAAPNPETNYTPVVPNILSSRITPPAEMLDGELVHVLDKGEYLTLEVFAQSGDGKPIYANWKDTPVTKGSSDPKFKGRFSVPNGAPERMEFYPEFDIDGDGVMEANIWRSVWTWTPPKAAEAGDRYNLGVDVKDAKLTISANIPDIPPVDVAPPGEIVFERRANGRWHLFTMWANGSRVKQLTKGPHDYRCASATADGKLLAFERSDNPNNPEVWVMNADGTGQIQVAARGSVPTISPVGTCIAYLDDGKVWVKRLDSAGNATDFTATIVTSNNGTPNPGNRLAFSPDGRWLYYTGPSGKNVEGARLAFPGNGIEIVTTVAGADVPNTASSEQVGGIYTDRNGGVFYHADDLDPYIGRYDTVGGEPTSVGSSYRESIGEFETYPAISPDGKIMLFCEKFGGGPNQIATVPIGNWTDANSGTFITSGAAESLRPAWIRQRGN